MERGVRECKVEKCDWGILSGCRKFDLWVGGVEWVWKIFLVFRIFQVGFLFLLSLLKQIQRDAGNGTEPGEQSK